MIEWIKNNKQVALGGIIVILAGAYFLLKPAAEESNVLDKEEEWLTSEGTVNEKIEEDEEVEVIVIVDVKGAVNKPGVYEAEAEDRVIDMINKAGGLKESADEAKINFAIRVEDEMVIYVPEKGEETEQEGSVSMVMGGTDQKDGKVNINTADETELQTLTGIGPAKAAAIIDYREKNGPFKVIEDLKLISGIGEKSFEKLKEQIKVK
ncbi:helix-hairpin-helix domain-containing protein [Cytobacillus massiliigabonensis]|uniref:helix-hairpin-helix domain-containing protein n=1 Tax=Cytobacillus massiliigabonensis TaxID=1871011 RepID=UPI000C84367D|nr:helix-hairpin-helix domain-containing protein [Cytobacillus massiliigabonensis]